MKRHVLEVFLNRTQKPFIEVIHSPDTNISPAMRNHPYISQLLVIYLYYHDDKQSKHRM